MATCIAPFQTYSQDLNTNQLIDLGKYYSEYMFYSSPSKSIANTFGAEYDKQLLTAVAFVKEGTRTKNKLLTRPYLTLPDTTTLKVIYIINGLHQNPFKKNLLSPINW